MSNINKDLGGRARLIVGFICLIVGIYLIQLFNLQILNDDYKESADSNAFLKKTRYPSRGILYDRNGKLLVYNQPAYDVMVVMRETRSFDTLAFCKILNITPVFLKKRIIDIKNRNLNPGYSSYVPQTFLTQLGSQECGVLLESLYKFPGFYVQNRTVREYCYPNAAHILGYIAEVDKKKMEEDEYYVQGDYIGKAGVERSYEKLLRGEKGVEILLRDAHGRIKGKYEDGKQDSEPVSGKNLTLSIDIDLQAYAEELLVNKMGSVIMTEPSTGEILCMAASPTYDPSILIGRKFKENYKLLAQDSRKPLIDRSTAGKYPPGSTFKPAQALVFLEEEAIRPTSSFSCNHGFPLGGRPKCHAHGSPLPLVPAIATSCNAYFCWGMKALLENRKKYENIGDALDTWKNHIVSQGFGYQLGIDLPGELRGFIPNRKYYDKIYSERWNAFTVISISIGQGEVTATPIQICNLATTIANRGHYYVPHIVKSIQGAELDTLYTRQKQTTIRREHYETVVEGMSQAVNAGTCWSIAMPDIEICGKTGTAENPAGKDHSVFIGFAPRENPKVAISVYIEHGGFGASCAVPIAKLMLEKYLKGGIDESDLWIEENIKNMVISPNALQKD